MVGPIHPTNSWNMARPSTTSNRFLRIRRGLSRKARPEDRRDQSVDRADATRPPGEAGLESVFLGFGL